MRLKALSLGIVASIVRIGFVMWSRSGTICVLVVHVTMKKMMRMESWKKMIRALLNDEGLKVWGFVFPDGGVPVRNLVAQKAVLDFQGEAEVYLVDWAALTQEQRDLILKQLAAKFHAPVEVVETEVLKNGLPLRAKYVSCISIPNPQRWFV